ncbi:MULTISPECIES: hypothetical protein [Chryseobacterium]|uniref:hypothetical protein n=1 Tax=Chryseobacterium sp. R2A-55 TaxID=2744445 RepID=UPI001F3E7E86|nr:hypothetical protein [Chryseobacterium sp. R2A-55]
MKDIKQFIEQFIQAENQFTKMKYDILVSDDDCQAQAEKYNSFFHSNNAPNDRRTGREFKNEEKKAFSITNKERAIPRSFFQIKHYENSVLGDALKRIVTGTDIYACYLSYPSKGGRDLYFSSIFYVAQTNEGQKIIYYKGFNSDTGIWYHPVDLDTVTVFNEGKLIEVEKYKAPEEETSLADYNKE